MTVPEVRIQACNGAPVNGRGEFVLYWMIAHRRTTWNFSLQLAVDWARQLNRPLIVFEALRCDYPWASDRHREGMGHLILGWRWPLRG
jgi:deoxyribodipyrimidine photo-lyase